MQAKVYGFYPCKVVNLKDPQNRGRIKVASAELLTDSISAWCEPCVPNCFEGSGDFCLPEIDDYVWVSFVEGDLNRPVYFGGWWNKDNSPLKKEYKNLDNIRRIGFHDTVLEFKKKEKSLDISVTKTTKITIKDGVVHLKAEGGEVKIEDGKITLNGDVTLKGDVTIKGDLSVNSVSAKTVSASSMTAGTFNGNLSGKVL